MEIRNLKHNVKYLRKVVCSMKKKLMTLITVAIISELAAITVVFYLFSYFLKDETIVNAVSADTKNVLPGYSSIYSNRKSAAENSQSEKNHIDGRNIIEAYIDFVGDRVIIKEDLYFKVPDRTEGNDINHVSNENDINCTSAVDKVYLYIPSLNAADTTIKNIFSNNDIINSELNGMVLEIQLNRSRQDNPAGQVQNTDREISNTYISIDFEILLNNSTGTISRSCNGKCVYLANFLATPAVFAGETPVFMDKTSFGDPYIYDMNNYYITFKTDKDMEIYAPGIKEGIQNPTGNTREVSFTAKNLRDFSAVILNGEHDIHIEKVKNTNIYYINTSKANDYVREAFLFAVEKIGPYPYDKLFVVKADIHPLKGMEFSNMVFLSDKCFTNKEDLQRVAYHEVFHQWFYGIIGTNQINEPFLDEGMVNYLSMKLMNDNFGNTFDSRFLDMTLRDYGSRNDYYKLAYTDAAVFMANIHQKMGDDFYKLLQKIYNDKKFTILYYNEFEEYLRQFSRGGY